LRLSLRRAYPEFGPNGYRYQCGAYILGFIFCLISRFSLVFKLKNEVKKMTPVRVARLAGSLLLALVVLALPGRSFAQVAVSITLAPPVLPVYTQPVCPGEGYLWTPGYWAWDVDFGDYYWVPGTWVVAPEVGFLWTPGYWGWGDGAYLWHEGYWGANIGFYGGVYYGFGYFGTGFAGGYWQGGNFFYNTSVMNVNTTIIHNTYTKTVVNNVNVTHVSYNGGHGGTTARPTAEEEKYAGERHIPPTAEQTKHVQAAAADRSLRASVNHGKPPVAASSKAGDFKTGVVPARSGGNYKGTATKGASAKREAAARTSKPSKAATSEHARAPRTESKPTATHHESTAKTESKTGSKTESKTEPKPAKPATTEHAKASHTEAKSAATHHESTAKTESKPAKTESKPAKTEHAKAPKPEAKPAATHKESTPKAESKPPKPAKTEQAKVPKAESKPAPTHQAVAHNESAPKPQHQSAPRTESKPAPAPKEEKKPPR
jgi:hypothetical protein